MLIFAHYIKNRAMIKENFIKLYENSFKENWDLPCYTDYGEDTTFTYGQVAEEIGVSGFSWLVSFLLSV